MRFIITAGGTTELIDPVRKITNSATGRLGSLVAERLAARGGDRVETIHYVCERDAIVPELDRLHVVRVRGVHQTEQALAELLGKEPIDAVVHSMAVSDYTVSGVSRGHEIAQGLAGLARRWASEGVPEGPVRDAQIAELLAGSAHAPSEETKLSSGIDDLVLLMARTPKLINMVKRLQPKTLLVGFKLLNHVPEADLLAAARRLREANGCDFVLANDLTGITAEEHRALLLAGDDSVTRFTTKAQIADGIARAVIGRIEEGRR